MQSQESQKIRGVVNFQQEISNCIFLPGGTHLLIPLVKLVSHGGNDGKWNGAPTGHRQQCSQPCQQCSQPAQRCSQPGGVLRVGSRVEMKRFGGEKRRFPMNNVQQKYGKHEFCYKLVKTHGQNCEKGWCEFVVKRWFERGEPHGFPQDWSFCTKSSKIPGPKNFCQTSRIQIRIPK